MAGCRRRLLLSRRIALTALRDGFTQFVDLSAQVRVARARVRVRVRVRVRARVRVRVIGLGTLTPTVIRYPNPDPNLPVQLAALSSDELRRIVQGKAVRIAK